MPQLKPTFLRRADLPELHWNLDDEEVVMITVRVPKSLRNALLVQAHQQNTSLNKLCTSRLIARIDGCLMIPNRRIEVYRYELAGEWGQL